MHKLHSWKQTVSYTYFPSPMLAKCFNFRQSHWLAMPCITGDVIVTHQGRQTTFHNTSVKIARRCFIFSDHTLSDDERTRLWYLYLGQDQWFERNMTRETCSKNSFRPEWTATLSKIKSLRTKLPCFALNMIAWSIPPPSVPIYLSDLAVNSAISFLDISVCNNILLINRKPHRFTRKWRSVNYVHIEQNVQCKSGSTY